MAGYNEVLRSMGMDARKASGQLAHAPTGVKNRALEYIANDLESGQNIIIEANDRDCRAAKEAGMDAALLDRLMLNKNRIEGMAADVRKVMELDDPIGQVMEMRTLANGLIIGKKRVPLGVIAAIYESRPNVTIDISSLCLKSGNCLILRGGKEAFFSNRVLAGIVSKACLRAGLPEKSVQFIENTERGVVNDLLKMNDYVDLVIPRGGAGLINMVKQTSAIPVVAGGIGVCHTYVDREADIDQAVKIVINAKTQRPTVCNALDTVIVHSQIAPSFLQKLGPKLQKSGVEMRCDDRSFQILDGADIECLHAGQDDFGKEFLALIIAIKVVETLDEAIDHIARYGSGHSEAIISQDYPSVMRFLNEVDAACVYANASTRFTDGSQFGLGAELGISTQKFHARGPLGLKEITSYKWIIFGSGQVRP